MRNFITIFMIVGARENDTKNNKLVKQAGKIPKSLLDCANRSELLEAHEDEQQREAGGDDRVDEFEVLVVVLVCEFGLARVQNQTDRPDDVLQIGAGRLWNVEVDGAQATADREHVAFERLEFAVRLSCFSELSIKTGEQRSN